MTRLIQVCKIFVLFLLMLGCGGGSDLPPLGKVSGVVKFDGKPVSGVTVYFWPNNGGRTCIGVSDENGNYTMRYNADAEGVPLGMCEVRIEGAIEKVTDEDGKVLVEGRKEFIPAKYNNQTTLQQEVKAGSNTCHFDLNK